MLCGQAGGPGLGLVEVAGHHACQNPSTIPKVLNGFFGDVYWCGLRMFQKRGFLVACHGVWLYLDQPFMRRAAKVRNEPKLLNAAPEFNVTEECQADVGGIVDGVPKISLQKKIGPHVGCKPATRVHKNHDAQRWNRHSQAVLTS